MANLYVFHQGFDYVPDGGQLSDKVHLWYNVFDGNTWSGDTQIRGVNLGTSPYAVPWLGGISLFHQGVSTDGPSGRIAYTYSPNGRNWGADTPVQQVGMSEHPSLVVYKGKLYVFHQGYAGNGELWYFTYDGTNWSGDTQIRNVGMSASPAAVVWAGGITVFHQGYHDDGQLWYTYSPDGTNWGGDTLVQPVPELQGDNVPMSLSPSAVVYKGKLYVFCQGPGQNGGLSYVAFDGNRWYGFGPQLPNLGMSESPSAVAWAGGITVFHQGSHHGGELWYTYSPDGTNWSGDTHVQPGLLRMSGSPSAIVF